MRSTCMDMFDGDDRRSTAPLPEVFHLWETEVEDAEFEAYEAARDLGEYGIFTPASMFERPDENIDTHLTDQDRIDLAALDPDHESDVDRYAQLRARLSNTRYVLGINGALALDFLEGFGHMDDHDCEWGASRVWETVEALYSALGMLLFEE